MNCPNCGGPTIELFTSRVCKAECEKGRKEPGDCDGYYVTTGLEFHVVGETYSPDKVSLPTRPRSDLRHLYWLVVRAGIWEGDYWKYINGWQYSSGSRRVA